MIRDQINSNFPKGRALVILEYVLLGIYLCVIALRTTLTEGPSVQLANQSIDLGGIVYSLLISAVLILSCIVWFVWGFCSKRFCYRFTGMEIGLCLFAIGAVIAGFAAANKRAALSDVVFLVAPVLMAMLLVQILDSHSKVKLLLICIAALGIVSAYQCSQQLFFANQAMIDQYEEAPWSMLEPLGIRAGTLQHFLFEHRLYSRGVHGFFTTGNSAGSFALLACFAAVALFLEKFKNRKLPASGPKGIFTCGIGAGVVIFGLSITKSKGAIAAAVFAAAMFVVYLLFGEWVKRHRKAILIVCLLLALISGGVVVLYGMSHGRLPGGQSMLVRWQYWQASLKLFADHPLTGIGPGNFAHFYTRYKPAAALESVADPHNFLLSVLTQYGPVGLVGFLALILAPLSRVISPRAERCSPEAGESGPTLRKLIWPFAMVIAGILLLVRSIIMPIAGGVAPDVLIFMVFFLYIAPVLTFIVGIWLLAAGFYNTQSAKHDTNIIIASLFCACLGVLLHNLIDFAIFEPGVFMTFWAVIASLIALDLREKSRRQFVLRPAAFAKVIVVAGGVVITWTYLNYCLVPVVKSTSKIKKASQVAAESRFTQAYNLLNSAAKDDSLSSLALSLNGRLYFQNASSLDTGRRDLLMRSETAFLAAIQRNPADFKNFERLTKVYSLLAETSPEQERNNWLNKAFDAAWTATELYPGLARLRLELAGIADKLDKTDIAISQYHKAIEIEDSFRMQFQVMYPGRKIFSRLGENEYDFAVERVNELSENSSR
ncbi:MAG: O-antigen ligase family protein [Planctomycetota bacterium]|nr:MAG: O-antigen ligase family protein [Planctomycetota bacterium]